MATNKKKSEALAKKQSSALAKAGMDFEADSGKGLEETDSDSFSMPFLKLLQSGSPETKKNDGKFVKGATSGMFINSVTKELFDEVMLVPAHYHRRMVHWRDRDDGGGFLGSYLPNDDIVKSTERGDSGKLMLEDGTHLSDTRYHFVVILKDDGEIEPAVIGLSSTQIKKSKDFLTFMRNIRLERSDGSKFNPPTYSHLYKLTSVGEAKDSYTWDGVKFEIERQLTANDVEVYQAAKLFEEQVREGEVGVDRSSYGDDGDSASDGIPEEF